MSTYKLYYFNGRGRAEVSRLILIFAGQKFDDVRIEHNDWPSRKPEMPLGQMPVLEYNGVKLSQSGSVARFLAKQFNLAGKDDLEQAKVDAVVDTIADAMMKYMPIRLEQDETKKQELIKKFFADELPKHLHNLDVLAKLYSDGGVFFLGNQLTWADLLFYDILQTFLELDGNCLDKHPWLQKNREEVASQPRIAEYLKNRPKTPF